MELGVIFKKLWNYKIFKIALFIHIGYLITSTILTLTFFQNQNDFLIYFKAGGFSITDINELYNQTNYRWPYRYFPITALIFAPFYLLGFELGFVLFSILTFIIFLLITYLLFKLVHETKLTDMKCNEEDIAFYSSLYLIGLPVLFNYILGQINMLVVLFIILSLLTFLKYKSARYNFFGGFILGISFLIKPISILIIPFLLIINYDRINRKISFNFQTSFLRILGSVIPVALNFFVFLIFPNLLIGFIQTNLAGTSEYILNFSFSITKLVTNFFSFFNLPFNEFLIFIIILSILLGGAFYFFLIRKKIKYSLVYGYLIGIIIMLLVYFDSWNHHLLVLEPLLILVILLTPKQGDMSYIRSYLKWSFYFFSFLDLAFMGLWYITKEFFPFNFESTLFLILSLYSIIKLQLNPPELTLDRFS